ncbi:putative HAT dimerization domain, ribonuclease H-like domain-containing protein [Medicago truncatula]|uniref:Putative HAT dimerization domain, ribonuclease H-like domain-containing protein n=1 Tax=Medicago truncatula TaxID=3880 RepID=A0A396GTE7_MEDTR|nr:putative HAT dimerization domain, ribonuclease H-like domain-containing protein [Medicago truncatula]
MQLEEENSEDFEMLRYWKLNAKKYLTLSIMARDILSIPITTVASNSSFSIGGSILTKYISSTFPEHVQMLICARSWMHGFSENSNDGA